MENSIVYGIKEIIEEIEACTKCEKYFAALTMALILPDICSKIESNGKKGGENYIKWCNKWLHPYFAGQGFSLSLEIGKIIYKLRCGILHNAENDVKKYEYNCFNLDEFEFYLDESERDIDTAFVFYEEKYTGDLREEGYENKAKIKVNIKYLLSAIVNGTCHFINKRNLTTDKFPCIEIFKMH